MGSRPRAAAPSGPAPVAVADAGLHRKVRVAGHLRQSPVRGRESLKWPTLPQRVPLRANALISALRTSSYCLVTRAQLAARASISSTCHPILPGRAVGRPAIACRRRRPAQRCLVRERGWATALHRPTRPCGRLPTPRSVTASVATTRCGGADLERRVAWFSHLLDAPPPPPGCTGNCPAANPEGNST
jgi:hypothetical protein